MKAQEYLDNNFTKSEKKDLIKLDVSEQELEGILNLSEFPNLEELNCNSNYLTEIALKENSKLRKLHCSHNHLTRLIINNQPSLTEIDCSYNRRITGDSLTDLTVTNNANLIRLQCSNCSMTNLELKNNPNLETVDCWNNKLSDPIFLTFLNKSSIKSLWMGNNDFAGDLELFADFTNLERLNLNNNSFNGSLASLENCFKLRTLRIENTEITEGLEYLPHENLNVKDFATWSKGTPFAKQLEMFNYDLKAWKLANHSYIAQIEIPPK